MNDIEKNEIDPYGVRDIQRRLLVMLKDLDQFCRKNKIKYSVDGGTLLGVKRHKGFIPWDDDVDVMFDRRNYSKFIKRINLLPDKYKIVGDTWVKRMAFKNSPYDEKRLCIDLFVWDNVPDNRFADLFKRFMLMLLQGMLKRKVDYSSYSPVYRIPIFVTHVLGLMFSVKTKQRMYDRVSQWGNKKKTKKINIFNAFFDWVKDFSYDRNLMKHVSDIEFEDTMVMAVDDADRYLTVCYGDYMKLPPEDQRIPSHQKEL